MKTTNCSVKGNLLEYIPKQCFLNWLSRRRNYTCTKGDHMFQVTKGKTEHPKESVLKGITNSWEWNWLFTNRDRGM